ncbi:retrovirus-related pol polyprotein from transposon TNT 1-94 [Tanacetum coccineum]
MVGSLFSKFKKDKVIKCYNCKGEGHMARQCKGKELDEEHLTFIADPGVVDGQVAQTITHNAAFQTDDLNVYNSYCDDISSAKAVLMANLSILTPIADYPDNEITSDSNIIPYSQYLEETQHAIVQNTNTSTQQNSIILSMFEQMSNHATTWDTANNESKIVIESLTAELERYKERVKIFEQRFNVDLSGHEKFIDSQMDDMIRMKNKKFDAFETEIDTLKHDLSKHVKDKEFLLTTLNGLKMEFKERESKSIDKEILLENKNKELENILSLIYQNPFYLKRAQRIKLILYDGNVLSKTHDVLSMVDDEETLILAKESRLKMVEKQNDLIMKTEKINITQINYSELNKIAEDFGKRFVVQQELFAEQKFWLQSSDKNSKEPSTSNTPVKIEVPNELPKVSLVNKSLKKLRFHLASFDKVVKVRITPDAITKGSWGFEHTKKVSKPHATTIDPGMYKLNLEPLEIVKSTKALSPLDSNLDSACKYVQRIQDMLVYIRDTRPCLTGPSEKLVVVTPKNKDMKVRFADPVTSLSNTQKQVDSHKQKDSNQPLLHSIGVISSTGASRSKPTSNTKNNRISQSSSSNKTNKVEGQSRSVKSRKNKKNHVAKTECNAYVMQSMLNANSKSLCAIYNECLFDANHDKYVLDYVHDVNVLSKSTPAKHKNKK